MDAPFSAQVKTLSINVTATASVSAALPGKGNSLRVVNEGSNIAFISVGSGAQTATVPPTSTPVNTCTPVLPGSDVIFTIPKDQVYNISAVCRATQTTVLNVQVG